MNSMRNILIRTLLITTVVCSAVVATSAELPNVVLIYADDLGYGDVQCYNPDRGKIATPNIDRLASQGMKFTDAHSSSGVCSPSRYTILTGRYHWRSRLQSGIVGLWGAPLITSDRVTIGSLAKQNGYDTVAVGKWHLGWNWDIPREQATSFKARPKTGIVSRETRSVWKEVFSRPIKGGPTAVGFDQYFGTDVPNWPPYCFIENERTVGIPTVYLPQRLLGNNQASQQGPALEGWTLEPILPALGNRAEKYIQSRSDSEKPFLMYMPLTSPHTPLSVNKAWIGKSGLGLYADFVIETDAIVGQVLDAIDTAGLAANTLVLFTSDNGCAPYIGVSDLEKQGHYPSGPLRGYKADAWEGGHRVPFIVRWPGKVKPSSECGQLVHQADVLATLAAIFETPLAVNQGEDSFSLVPLLQGQNTPIRTTSVSCSVRGIPSLRDGQWKYIAAPGSGGWGKGGDQTQSLQLYDLANDLEERVNLAAERPGQLKRMVELLGKVISNGRSTPGPRQPNDVPVRRHPAKR
ncbi:MAG: arylsulfatase [Rubripirellula sp.]|nr:arylsulfatase [Rubripirellula sp.]